MSMATCQQVLEEGLHPNTVQYLYLLEADTYTCTAKWWVSKFRTQYAAVEAGIQAEHAAHWAFKAFPELRLA